MTAITEKTRLENIKINKSKIDVVRDLRLLNYSLTDGIDTYNNLIDLEGKGVTVYTWADVQLFSHLIKTKAVECDVIEPEQVPERNFPPLALEENWDMAIDKYSEYLKAARKSGNTPDSFVAFLMANFNLAEKV